MAEKESSLKTLWAEIRRYLELNLEYAKLTGAEKITILLTAIATAVVIGVLAILIFFFFSIACVHWLGDLMSMALAYTIMAAVYALVLVVFIVFRRELLINPVAKFISRLILR
nr:phage holin family protein [Bacteroides sp.]